MPHQDVIMFLVVVDVIPIMFLVVEVILTEVLLLSVRMTYER